MKRAILVMMLISVSAGYAKVTKQKRAAREWMQQNSAAAVDCARDIWEHPELGELETYSSERLAEFLERGGFEITRGVAGMPTAWVATYTGAPGPVIGFLAEFDALPGLSQAAEEPTRKPLVEGGAGHGCGHNLLGTASAFAALGVRQAMIEHKLPGTVKVFGCPAEETLVGKVYMAREGIFDGVEAMLAWHPGSKNQVSYSSSLAMSSLKFRFYGKTAHGAGDPHHGRSSLDAVELMSAGVNYMREHVIDKARIHYVVTNGGGAPNVVPDLAEVWYFVRAPKTEQQRPILEWVREIARGAAVMTGTRVEEELLASCYELLLNDPLSELLQENLEEVGPPQFDEADREFARKLSESFDEEPKDSMLLDTTIVELKIVPPDEWKWGGGSTDDGDVSWNVPCGRMTAACNVKGSPGHSWQVVSCTGSQAAFKGMTVAAKVLAGAGVDLLHKPKWIERAQEDFVEKLAGRTYECGVPDSLPPPHSR
jgi:aminobenzoyl-glutamate utilization protein B